jgi:hypothetical protein
MDYKGFTSKEIGAFEGHLTRILVNLAAFEAKGDGRENVHGKKGG